MLVKVYPMKPEERQELIIRSGGPQFSPSDAWIPVHTSSGALIHVRREDVVEGTEDILRE